MIRIEQATKNFRKLPRVFPALEATMKFTRSNRIVAALMAVLFLCASVPAQYRLGTRRMIFRETPTLMNQSRLPNVLGSRPRIGFAGRVGGIASDGVAAP